MKKIIVRMTALMALMMITISAQAKTQDWGGRVVDEKGEPMPFVNVVLLSLPDSAFVQGGMTDEQGVFKIVTNVDNGLFKVTSIGYQTLYIKAGRNLTIQMKGDYSNFRMTSTRIFTHIGLQRDLNLKRMGTLTFDLRCSDIFNTNKTDAILYGYRELTIHNPARRTFVLDITWKFNEARLKYRGSGAGEKQKARM